MSSLAFLLEPELLPFASALAMVAGLCLLEVLMALVGLTLLGDAGGDIETEIELDADLDAFDAAVDLDAADTDLDAMAPASGGIASALSWLGIGKVPLMIWVAGTLTAFGIAGYALQLGAAALLGGPLPAMLAAAIALPPGLVAGARVARLLGRLVPKTESSAISTRSYGGRRGVITTGTARRGAPAEARFRDGHGNTHYALVEPLHDGDEIPQGAEIAITRLGDGRLRAIRLDDATA